VNFNEAYQRNCQYREVFISRKIRGANVEDEAAKNCLEVPQAERQSVRMSKITNDTIWYRLPYSCTHNRGPTHAARKYFLHGNSGPRQRVNFSCI